MFSIFYCRMQKVALILVCLAWVGQASQERGSYINHDGVDESGWDPQYRSYRDKQNVKNTTDTRDKSKSIYIFCTYRITSETTRLTQGYFQESSHSSASSSSLTVSAPPPTQPPLRVCVSPAQSVQMELDLLPAIVPQDLEVIYSSHVFLHVIYNLYFYLQCAVYLRCQLVAAL